MIDWIMYSEIQALKRKGFKKARAASNLNINRETVSKYWDMTPDEYAATKVKHKERKADVYRSQIIDWLTEYPDMTAAQLYDWCKERNRGELSFQKRSFQNYINSIREECNIRKPETERQYEATDERAPGAQAQVDMGEIYVPTASGRHKKVYCFAMVLCHSRYKFVCWQEKPFTTDSFILSHVNAFKYFGGCPKEIVYDQDKVLAVSENNGDIIYTEGFQSYLNEVGFSIYLCRGADPESKGPIENVVKFAKHGFAEHRTFADIESFNEDCLAWLKRTANHDKHGTTKKRPDEVFAIEKEYLTPISENSHPATINNSISYSVRKDNIVLYKGNRYRVPLGTYHPGLKVYMILDEETDKVAITDVQTAEVYATHSLCHDKGQLIGTASRNYRDKSKSIIEQEEKIISLFGDTETASPFLDKIHKKMPRYYRDQLGVIKSLFSSWEKEDVIKGLNYCIEKELYSANDLKSSIIYLTQHEADNNKTSKDNVAMLPDKYRSDVTELRSLSIYENALSEGGAVNG